jgi:micrococcal nuclease
MSYRVPMSRRTRRLVTAGIAVVLCILIAVDRLGMLSRSVKSDAARYHEQTFRVVKVVDGDTLDLDVEDSFNDKPQTRVRLWGVDTSETHPRSNSKQTGPMYFGPEASEFTKHLVLDKRVTVRLEPVETSRGKYRRLLAYIYLPDGRMLNEELIRQGYGYADERFAHMYRRRFLDLQKEAQQEKRGLWRAVKPEQWPEWYRNRHGKTK